MLPLIGGFRQCTSRLHKQASINAPHDMRTKLARWITFLSEMLLRRIKQQAEGRGGVLDAGLGIGGGEASRKRA